MLCGAIRALSSENDTAGFELPIRKDVTRKEVEARIANTPLLLISNAASRSAAVRRTECGQQCNPVRDALGVLYCRKTAVLSRL